MKILVTGGAGFIGSAFVRYVLANQPDVDVVTLDKLTYAGNLENLATVADNPRHRVRARRHLRLVRRRPPGHRTRLDAIVHFAAESHVDRSILSPDAGHRDQRARHRHAARRGAARPHRALPARLDRRGLRRHRAAARGRRELSAEAEQPVRRIEGRAPTFWRWPTCAPTSCRWSSPARSNNYGPYQFPEKLIPLMISNALEGKPLPVYGDGLQVRDWLYVDDHCRGICAALDARPRRRGLQHRRQLRAAEPRGRPPRAADRRRTGLADHDGRRPPGPRSPVRTSSDKLARETGFVPAMAFDEGLAQTVQWYQDNPDWTRRVKSGEYRDVLPHQLRVA